MPNWLAKIRLFLKAASLINILLGKKDCAQLITEDVTFEAAQDKCIQLKSTLIEPTSLREFEDMFLFINYVPNNVWLNFHDDTKVGVFYGTESKSPLAVDLWLRGEKHFKKECHSMKKI